MLSAVFLNGCVTVHDYKRQIDSLGSAAVSKVRSYEIAECYAMKYEDFIYLCNHLNERRSFFKPKAADDGVLQAALLYCARADKVLLVYSKNSGCCEGIAVLYNAGKKVDIRPNNHTARKLRNAEKRLLR